MGKKIDLTGKRFGRLTVIEDVGRDKWGSVTWRCLCDCGKQSIVPSGSLMRKTTTSCGCFHKESTSMNRSNKLLGMTFGYLRVVSREGSNSRRKSLWRCKCVCGNEVIKVGVDLVSGNTKSCGCMKANMISESLNVWSSRADMYNSPINNESVYFGKIPSCDNPGLTREGIVTVSCKLCGKRFSPTRNQIHARIRAFSGDRDGEHNFYCSDACRAACPVFGADPNRVDPRLRKLKLKTKTARGCQTKTLKQLQCDHNNGQSYCEKCQDFVDVELHHTIQVSVDPASATNPASHMLLCAGCHVELHRECR